MRIGLRIDVDTFKGTKLGVPNLCKLLEESSMKASFFFSVGPDNMGRHLWRLIRPAFLMKMLRTKATSLYGWDILFKGTFWPGPLIGKNLAHVIRSASNDGHEIGLHAWDHQRWQARIEKMDDKEIYDSIKKGIDVLTDIIGYPPTCSAVPGWKCTDDVLKAKTNFAFRYNSDTRGQTIFNPTIDARIIDQPQIPVTLPTYDETVGQNNITDQNYNEHMLSLLDPEKLNVLTIHAEVEGISYLPMFKQFIDMAKQKGYSFVPLGNLLEGDYQTEPTKVIKKEIPGREGWTANQKT